MASYSLFNSSIGRKFVMGLTGLFLISFLIIHVSINSCIYFNDGGQTFNHVAEFMANNIIIRTLEIGLFLGFFLHIIQSYLVTRQNAAARPVPYAMHNGRSNSTWYSRSMGLLGTLILIFLIIHINHFWVVSRLTDEITSGRETLFGEMKEVFSELWVVILYCFAMVSLSYHLMHGFQSAFQSMGWNHRKYMPFVKKLGFWFSILIPILFASMPVAFYMGWIE